MAKEKDLNYSGKTEWPVVTIVRVATMSVCMCACTHMHVSPDLRNQL